jgi:phospholipid/cholesterol/gamma-HCH transport system substrate-binding protein
MNTTARIGAFALIVLAVLAALILKIEDIPFGAKRRTGSVEVRFADVAGLDDKSAVRIAGVRVGRVDGIRLLSDGSAVARLLLESEVELRGGAYGQVRNLGLLGDKYVDLFPGAAGAARLPDGTRLEGSIPTGVDDLTKVAADIGKDVKQLTAAFAGSLGGETGEKKLDRIVDNIGQLAEALRKLVEANRGNVDVTMGNLREFSGSIRETLARLDRILDENRASLKGSVTNVDELTGKLKSTADNLTSITTKIDQGDGTLGKLLNDDATHRNLNEALTSIKTGVESLGTTLNRMNRIDLELGFYGELMPRDDSTMTAFRVDVVPRENKFYRVEVVGRTKGRRVTDSWTTTTSVDGGPPVTVRTDSERYEDKMGLSVQLGRRFRDTVLRAGLIEGRGGVAVDQLFLKDRLQLTAEAWDFSREGSSARLKAFAQYQTRGSMFFRAGVDEALASDRRSVVVGAGLTWKDEDIKTLLGSLSLLK